MKKTSILLGCALLMALGGCASNRASDNEDYRDLATGRDYERCQDEVAEQDASRKERDAMMQACLDARGYDRHERGY
ncbi:MAG: hypothetical protein Q4G70_12365 [Pseudomonadota bacterium]|nr:hypothetical protein [Pseudomonadota bacterium]